MPVDYDAAALSAARRYCGWLVTPPETVTITVDGPGGRVLSLPTLRLTALTEVIEDGVVLDVNDLRFSPNTGVVTKKSRGCWTSHLGAIEVTMTHGFDTAPDFDAAVEQAARALSAAATRDDLTLKRKKIDDVEYEWYENATHFLNEALLSAYRILPAP